MRRALLRQMPAITRFYGIMPWQLGDFTVDELNEYIRQLDDHHKAQQQTQRQQRRRGGR